jgi:hypothetical protein
MDGQYKLERRVSDTPDEDFKRLYERDQRTGPEYS